MKSLLFCLPLALASTLSVPLLFHAPLQPRTELEWAKHLAPEYGVAPDQIEVPVWDSTRVDYLTGSNAVEIDFAPKWAEAIGQSLYYSQVTGKPATILLLVKRDEDRFVYRCQTVCAKHNILLWVRRI